MKMELSYEDVKKAVREVILEETGVGDCEIGDKWIGGKMVLVPFSSSVQSKEIPLENFFKKITAVREKLRVLEQKINNNDNLSSKNKLELQKLVTRAYGSLTTFNVLFKHDEDKFSGTIS